MKNPAYRPLVTPLRTYRRWPANIPQWPAIMSTSAMAPGRFWRVWTCTTGTSPRALRSATGVWSSSPCSRIWMPTTRRSARFGSSWTTTPRTFPKETRAYLATRPNRFKYVLTPTHGSWLNIVETLFGKMTRTFLRQIRVQSRAELKERILLGIAEINEMPVVHRWKAFELLEATSEAAS